MGSSSSTENQEPQIITTLDERTVENLKLAFQELDTDHNGCVSLEELVARNSHGDVKLSEEVMKQLTDMFNNMDLNHDNKVSVQEYISFVEKQQQESAAEATCVSTGDIDLSKVGDYLRTEGVKYGYGTAGFRAKSNTLDSVCFRMGMLAALRSRCFPTATADSPVSGFPVGVMLTASHNKEPDNGLKIVDPEGGMLAQSWEPVATLLANAPAAEVGAVLATIIEEHKIDMSVSGHVYIGRDTRESSPRLIAILAEGITAAGGTIRDFGICTTPQLHYAVASAFNGDSSFQIASYYTTLCDAFRTLIGDRKTSGVLVDCANGVGKVSGAAFRAALEGVLAIELLNTGADNLNNGCGAEHVQKTKQVPAGFDAKAHGQRQCASVDGDADRLVYYYTDAEGVFHLLDGDRIIALFAGFIQEQVAKCELKLDLGIVQTAYANGASTIYIQDSLHVPCVFTPTGVKHLHHKALEYDISVYFEANGHGTVLFSETTMAQITTKASDESASAEAKAACENLLSLRGLINQSTGDAFSDLLAVEAILAHRGWALSDWDELYSDLPSRMLKVAVPDRTAVKTTNAERTCVAPEGLQSRIDELVGSEDPRRRSFVRPSGTEDVVRVYAEAATQEDADQLAEQVKAEVSAFCG